MLKPTTAVAPPASRGGSSGPATAITTKANSPACANSNAISAASGRGTRNARATA